MAIAHEFEYLKPNTIDQAIDLLDKHKEKAKILAGGTDLVVLIKEGYLTPDFLIDSKSIPELNKLTFSNNELFVGANVTFSQLIENSDVKKHFKVLWEAAETVASIGVRNRATLTGNICSAVPSLDSAPALFCFDAEILVKNKQQERTIKIKDWFTGPKRTSLKSDELVLGIKLYLPKSNNQSTYKKLGRYSGEDLAQAGVGVVVMENNQYKISFCAVGPVPTRAYKIEQFLNGKELNSDNLKQTKELVNDEISPITDIRASKEYRTQMIKVMLERALLESKNLLDGKAVHSSPIL